MPPRLPLMPRSQLVRVASLHSCTFSIYLHQHDLALFTPTSPLPQRLTLLGTRPGHIFASSLCRHHHLGTQPQLPRCLPRRARTGRSTRRTSQTRKLMPPKSRHSQTSNTILQTFPLTRSFANVTIETYKSSRHTTQLPTPRR